MVELKGSLGGIGLPALVQLIGELHHSGTLELGHDDTQARLAFEEGRLVAADFGQEHGLAALASVALTLTDAEFVFVEGAPTSEQTLDFGPPELKSLLQRVMNGEFAAAEKAANASHAAQAELEHACPLLGFADDRERHYGRPTALHRCYASGSPSLVTSVEQRDLCLSGRFATCPRYRNWDTPPPPSLNRTPEPLVPAVIMQSAGGTDHPANPGAAPWRRLLKVPDVGGLQYLAIGVVLGVALVFLVFAVVLPVLNGGTAQRQARPAAPAPALQSVPTLVDLPPTPLPRPTAAPTFAPAPTAAPRPPTPAPDAQPAVAVAGSNTQSIMDVRFAQGPVKGWLDNPPFAGWSDGAYRVQSSQPARFVAIGVPTQAPLKDILVTATFRKTGGPPGGGYGLIVRDQGPAPRDGENQQGRFCVLETGDQGDFGIWRRDGDHWIDLAPWTRSSSVRAGGSPNELLVRAVGDELTFLVNGAQVASVTDGTLAAGGVGIFVGGDYNQIAVDRFTVALPD